MVDDVEKELRVGWPRLAQELAQNPCCEAFPRFRELNVKNLMYYQVEVAGLESELKKIEWDDYYAEKRPRNDYSRSAEKMLLGRNNADPRANEQRRIIHEIRRLLKEYNDALLQHAQITAMPHPNYINIENLRERMHKKEFGEDGIGEVGSSAWGDPTKRRKTPQPMARQILPLLLSIFWKRDAPRDERDLVTVHQPKNLDGFTRWVKQDWAPFYHHHLRRHRQDAQVVEYRESTMLKFTSAVAMVIACVLPTVAIGILTTAQTTMQKLLYIGGFTALFSIGVMWLSDSSTSRVSIFTATAAFSAVLVVFVQGQ